MPPSASLRTPVHIIMIILAFIMFLPLGAQEVRAAGLCAMVVCTAPDTCDPATGACVAPADPNDTPMGDVLCTVVGWMYGNLGRGLATLAILILGVGATLGKVSWGLALIVGIGIAIIFNADTIVSMLGAGADGC